MTYTEMLSQYRDAVRATVKAFCGCGFCAESLTLRAAEAAEAAALKRLMEYHDAQKAVIAELLAALVNLVACNERWNEAVQEVIGRPVMANWNDGYLDAARKAIARAKAEGVK